MRMQVRFLVADKAWAPPGGEFDENVLSQPGVMSNVVNGFGLVSAGYQDFHGIFPSEETVEETWFFDFLMRPPGNCFDYCSCR